MFGRKGGEFNEGRRSLLKKAGVTAVGGAASVLVLENTTSINVWPDGFNPFKGKTKEQTIDVFRRGISKVAKLVTAEVNDIVTAQIEVDAPFLDGIFDRKSTIICPTKLFVGCDLSAFSAPTDNTRPDVFGVAETTTTLAPVPQLGGIPALQMSDDYSSLTIRVPHAVIPPVEEVLPDIDRLRIINGQGGFRDKFQNLVGIQKIKAQQLIKKAQKDAWEAAKNDPQVIIDAEGRAKEILEGMFSPFFSNGVNVEFVNPYLGPTIDQVNPAYSRQSQASRAQGAGK